MHTVGRGTGPGVEIKEGFVQIPVAGRLDVASLSNDLREKGYYLANDPGDIDSQGWGSDYDSEGYYPYWVFRDGEQWVFAFAPEDYQRDQGGDNEPVVGEKARQEIARWVPVLESHRH